MRRPRLHPAVFDDILRDERLTEAIANFGVDATLDAVSKSVERPAQLDGIAKRLGWEDERRASFMKAVVAYRREPSIEHYLRVRREFPEVEIQVALFGELAIVSDLKDLFEEQGIELHLIAEAMDGTGPSIDALSLRLMQLLTEGKHQKSGPGHIEKRRGAVTDTMMNYLIAVMLESCRLEPKQYSGISRCADPATALWCKARSACRISCNGEAPKHCSSNWETAEAGRADFYQQGRGYDRPTAGYGCSLAQEG